MYAIIANGGKQYLAAVGNILKLEKLAADVGAAVEFDKVLLVSDDNNNVRCGTPYLENVKVVSEVLEHTQGEKVNIIKFRRRKHYLKHQGHRQQYTVVKITQISQ